jgi:hypothetical protein
MWVQLAGAWCTILAYMRFGRYGQLLALYACVFENRDGGYVQSTRNEFIGRLLGCMVEPYPAVFVSYSTLDWLISLAEDGNNTARFYALSWFLVVWYIMVFSREPWNRTGGNTLICIFLVDWIVRCTFGPTQPARKGE